MSENKKANPGINLVCGIVALACIAMMFIPTGEARGGFNSDWRSVGMMPYLWSEATSGFNSGELIYMIAALALTAAAVLLTIWAIQSFKGSAKGGLGIAIYHLLATAFVTLFMVEGFDGNLTLPLVIVNGALAIAALVLAILQRRAAK